MTIEEAINKINELKEDIKRVKNKLPRCCTSDTEVELNYFQDILPLLANTEELFHILYRIEIKDEGILRVRAK